MASFFPETIEREKGDVEGGVFKSRSEMRASSAACNQAADTGCKNEQERGHQQEFQRTSAQNTLHRDEYIPLLSG
jgi:hypothetical protein